MLEFLLALLTTATVAALLWPLMRMRLPARDRLSGELAIYRDQLAELERERAAGTLPTAEAAAARTEIERRMLAAGDAAATSPKTARASDAVQKWLPPALSLFVPLLALGLYLQVGRPGLPAAPFAERGAEQPAPSRQMDIAGLLAEARARLAQDPNDADALAALGEGLTLEAGGTVTQPALEALQRALKTRPDDARILYYLGLHEAQSGESKAAIARWRDLEAKSPTDAPWLPMLRAEIARVSKAAGIEVPPTQTPQSTTPQPSREQQEAMAQLTPEQRQQAIRTMVEGLAARLADAPQDRAGWLRLANAWKVLGENANAADAYARADTLAPVDAPILADWAEAHVRQLAPGAVPSPQAVAVLERLEKAEPRNALALFYLGVAAEAAGNKPAALQRWKTLLALLPADAPIRGMLEERIKAAGG
ncbi:MAG: c-type cytochrome biogenesis protein CcmI [Reyranella sp.]|uniref:c-type cytochrome biogenesis protein CcmI n=1 Tax=Reyranella sp. TaxID=1929291 RepID=UPI0012101A15|nr:c-type cytochrome biogenesis protein CcmI [Reyranella sp.]TAJ86390.1 MAG: c-type cytochrome biogenesis protein CcmI [Reyranella sp.]